MNAWNTLNKKNWWFNNLWSRRRWSRVHWRCCLRRNEYTWSLLWSGLILAGHGHTEWPIWGTERLHLNIHKQGERSGAAVQRKLWCSIKMLTISNDQAVKGAHGVVFNVHVQEVELHSWIWRTDEPGALLVHWVVFRPVGGVKKAGGLAGHQHSTTWTCSTQKTQRRSTKSCTSVYLPCVYK